MKTRFITKKRIQGILLLLLVLNFLLNPLVTSHVFAAQLTNAVLRFDRIVTSNTDTRVLVEFKPNDVTSLDTVRITFAGNGTQGAASYGVDSTPANITTSVTGLPSSCTSTTVTNAHASAVTGAQVDFAVTGVSATTNLYCFYITAGIDNPTTAATEYTSTLATFASSTELGSTDVVNYFITNDQVTVSAVVPPSFTFTLGANSTSFTADLSTSATRSTTGVTGTVVTNAANGWTAYLKGNAKLHSTAANYDISSTGTIDGTPETLSNGTEQYVLDVDATTGSPTIAGEYDGGASQGGKFNSADYEAIASGTGPTASQVFTMVGKAAISGVTKAANDYSDTWTVIAAGNF